MAPVGRISESLPIPPRYRGIRILPGGTMGSRCLPRRGLPHGGSVTGRRCRSFFRNRSPPNRPIRRSRWIFPSVYRFFIGSGIRSRDLFFLPGIFFRIFRTGCNSFCSCRFFTGCSFRPGARSTGIQDFFQFPASRRTCSSSHNSCGIPFYQPAEDRTAGISGTGDGRPGSNRSVWRRIFLST